MNDLQQYLVEEMVEEYQAGRITRRELLRRATLISGSAAVATTMMGGLGTGLAAAAPAPRPPVQTGPMVSPNDPALEAGMVDYPGDGASLRGYLARPEATRCGAGVILIHENRGMTDHQPDVARRLAKEGYVALAVDLLSRDGGTPSFPDTAAAMGAQAQLPPAQTLGDLNSAVTYLQSLPYVRAQSIGAMGHCYGGAMTWRLATASPSLKAAVPFYGSAPPLDAVPNIQAAVLGIYASDDERINAGIPDLTTALVVAGKTFEIVIVPNTRHAFFNETGPNYDADAARAAWQRTLAWFNTYLNA